MPFSLLTLALFCSAPELVLVESGQPRATIVTPPNPSPTVARAAAELADYVQKIAGAALPVVAEGQTFKGNLIHVGLTVAARKHLPAGFDSQSERVLLRSTPDGLVVCGASERATLFAVYRLLEHLGCRWLTPQHEFIPRLSRLAISALNVDTRPAFVWRLYKANKPEQEAWGLKLGFNGLYEPETATQNGDCLFWPDGIRGVHAYNQILPTKKYFPEHPQWFPLIRDERQPSDHHRGQLCVTAPGIADEFAANVIRTFDANPAAQLVSISPNDDGGWCECAQCMALDQKFCQARTTRQGLGKEKPFVGDRVFWFANEVADRVARKHPDKKLLVLAYINYAEPPDTIRPRPNVVPFLCHYAPADYSRPIADPSSPANVQFNDLLQRWMKVCPDLMIYSYVSKSMWWRLPRPVLHAFAADVKHYHALGVRRYYCQSSLSDWSLDGPLYYVIGRLLWDPTANPDALADDWTRHMFGPGAPHVAQFYAAVETAVRKTGQSYSDNPPRQVPGLYNQAELDRALAALEQAEKAATDEPYAERIAELCKTYRYGYWMIKAIDQHSRGAESLDAMQKAVAAAHKALGFCRVPEAARLVDQWGAVVQLGVPARGFGKKETKGGRECRNSDETGPGDHAAGWATFLGSVPDPARPVTVEMDVWGESKPFSLSVETASGQQWTSVRPETKLSGKAQWDTLVFRVPAKALWRERAVQQFGFGGSDSQIWVAQIRVHQEPAPERSLPGRTARQD